MAITKGTKIKESLEFWNNMKVGLDKSFKRRHESKFRWDMAMFYVTNCVRERRNFLIHLESMPKRFSKKTYTDLEYHTDIKNVKDHYTKWVREDFWEAKKSLSRIRRYEKRLGLVAFDEIIEKAKSKVEMERLNRVEGGIYA